MANVTEICTYRDIIDVRSPAEYEIDHIPGAVNMPVFSNAERAAVGTLYKTDPFAARRMGAALFTATLSGYLTQTLGNQPADWSPLIYCARGGQRSGGMVEVLRRIGWDAAQLEGGYKAYRHHVLDAIATLVPRQQWVVIAGKTGVGKTRLLAALSAVGAQTIDLEQLANHRGSVFGAAEQSAQPSQRRFESQLAAALTTLKSGQPVFVEAESRKIGSIHLPAELLAAMRAAPAQVITAPLDARIRYIVDEYDFFRRAPADFSAALTRLKPFAGSQRLAAWQEYYRAGDWQRLIGELLTDFYDIGYEKSLRKNYTRASESAMLPLDPNNPAAVAAVAQQIGVKKI